VAGHDFNSTILESFAHRPWPMPDRAWVMTQTWNDLLFAHWTIDPSLLRARIPDAFDLDLFNGEAWLAVVPFHMTNVAPRGVPSLPRVSAFPELNVRTYVRVGDRPGIYFFSLDAGNALAVRTARMLFNLPYYTAAMTVSDRGADTVEYHSSRGSDGGAEFHGTYGPLGNPFTPIEGSLEYFLTERYCLYHLDHSGSPYRLEIHHPPWPLQLAHAQITRNTMADVNGVLVSGPPRLLHFAKRQDVVAWLPQALKL
jgi:uncharacterized protein YqjF (DUF2071 family)